MIDHERLYESCLLQIREILMDASIAYRGNGHPMPYDAHIWEMMGSPDSIVYCVDLLVKAYIEDDLK